ncbi:MAG: hypothetical protein QGI63_08605 [Rhodospirillales bacterium]|nr:hypothetical protein [Rhodospirillales bacterium]
MKKVTRRLNLGSRLSPARGWRTFRNLLYATPLYGLTLVGRTPGAVRGSPPNPWPGDVTAAQALIEGAFIHGGRRMSLDDEPWAGATAGQSGGQAVAAALHGFAWLNDLATLGSPEAAQRGHALTASWLKTHGRWSADAWRVTWDGWPLRRAATSACFSPSRGWCTAVSASPVSRTASTPASGS